MTCADAEPGHCDSTLAVEQALMQYMEECYLQDTALEPDRINNLFKSATGPLGWSLRCEDGLPLLHLAVMNEVMDPLDMWTVVTALLEHGAPPNAKDSDGDTALEAILSLASDNSDSLIKALHMTAVRALVQFPEMHIGRQEVFAICSWLRRGMPETGREELFKVLEQRAGKTVVDACWISECLLEYLEQCAYEKRRTVEAQHVAEFLDAGADLSHTQNGATGLLLAVLNPFSQLDELEKVFRLILTKDPSVIAIRDGFRLTPLRWAADYRSIAQQHGLAMANPAALLALMPAIIDLVPPEIDAGECCFKVAQLPLIDNTPNTVQKPSTRFMEGDRVICRVETPGGSHEWEEGVVVDLWYREHSWPVDRPGAPYVVLLDIGQTVFALLDHDRIVRREAASQASALPPHMDSIPVEQTKGSLGSRFQKRQCEDGTWEVLDTVSGKARVITAPSSDEDDGSIDDDFV